MIHQSDTDTVHVSDQSLRKLNYLPAVGDIVKLNGKYYELAYLNLRGRMWWIEPIELDAELAALEDLPTATDPDDDLVVLVEFEDGEGTG